LKKIDKKALELSRNRNVELLFGHRNTYKSQNILFQMSMQIMLLRRIKAKSKIKIALGLMVVE